MSEPIKNPDGLYTTGEIAKLCGVSVRTVQYYDTRGILIPSSLTEGGRRLYTEADVGPLKNVFRPRLHILRILLSKGLWHSIFLLLFLRKTS